MPEIGDIVKIGDSIKITVTADDLDIQRLSPERDGAIWHGYLTYANAEAMAAKIMRLLDGRLYTYVSTWRGPDNEPDVRASQKLSREGVKASHGQITGSDSHGLWFIETTFKNRAQVNSVYAEYGELSNLGAWVGFEGNKITWRQVQPNGSRYYVAIAVERPENLEDY